MLHSQPLAGRHLRRATSVAALGLSLGIFLVELLLDSWPRPKPDTAAAREFSAARARDVLRDLLRENEPHPVGSPANRRVKERIVAKLEGLGLRVEEQKTVGCSTSFAGCAFVENIVTTLPGREPGRSLVLMAHYDSVAAGPGAGDDGAGVATLLEVARALSIEAPPRNSVVFLLTDGEEAGLLGAEAFFGQHPLSENIGVVINVEGSGSSGASRLLRTGRHNDWLIDTFYRVVPYPVASSLAQEVFEHMPNDTDFSVALRRDLPGFDFAFAGDRQHYHTPLDTVDRLSLVTLQHHGENLLPLTRELAQREVLQGGTSDRAYQSLFNWGWSWSQSFSKAVTSLAGLCWLLSAITLCRDRQTTLARIALALVFSLVVLTVACALDFTALELLDSAQGGLPPWPAYPEPLRLCLVGGALLALAGTAWIFTPWLDVWAVLLAVVCVWLGLGMVTAWALPNVTSLFLIPCLGLSVLLALSLWPPIRRSGHSAEVAACLLLAVTTPFTLRFCYLLEQALGYGLGAAALPLLALYALSAAPALIPWGKGREDKRLPRLFAAGIAALSGGLLIGVGLPVFSESSPQPINLTHVEDVADKRAFWLIESTHPLPSALAQTFEFAPPPSMPWLSHTSAAATQRRGLFAKSEPLNPPPPRLNLVSSVEQLGGRRLHAHFESPRGADRALILLPDQAEIGEVTINEQPTGSLSNSWLSGVFAGYQALMVSGVPAAGFELQLELREPLSVEVLVIDWSSEFPAPLGDVIRQRDRVAMPIHWGDRSLVVARVTL